MTAILGTTFLGFQAFEFTSFVHEGLTIRTNLFGSSFFTLTGFHGAHVTAGVLWLLTLLAIDFKRGLATEGRAATSTSPRCTGTSSTSSGSRSSRSSTSSSSARSDDHGTRHSRHTTPEIDVARDGRRAGAPDVVQVQEGRVILDAHHGRRGLDLLHRRSSESSLFVPVLLIMSAVKFAIVVLFYMHLKYDHKLFRALFTGPLIIAMSTLVALLFLFGKFAGTH